jgi:hypothetical protein
VRGRGVGIENDVTIADISADVACARVLPLLITKLHNVEENHNSTLQIAKSSCIVETYVSYRTGLAVTYTCVTDPQCTLRWSDSRASVP